MIRAELLGAWGEPYSHDWRALGKRARAGLGGWWADGTFPACPPTCNLGALYSGTPRSPPWRSAARVLYIRLASRTFNWEPGQRNGRDKRPNSKWGKLMAAEKAQNLQDTFLNHVRKSKTSVTIFLVNGVKLQGFVTWFDNFCVLLRRDGHSQLVYKHAISTIMPAAPIQMFEAVEEGAADHH